MAELLQFPFARGMDEGADPKGLPAGAVLSLENRYHDKIGRIVKRPGVSALATGIIGGGDVAAGVRLISRGDDLALFDGETLYTYSDTLAAWRAMDRPSPLTARVRPLVDTSRSVRFVDIAVSGNLLVVLYETGTTDAQYVYLEVRRLDTGEIVMPTQYVATAVNPRAVMNAAGTVAYLFYGNVSGGGNNLYVRTLTMSTLVLSAASAFVTDMDEAQPYDAVVPQVAGDDVIYVAYNGTAAADALEVASFETSTFTVVDSASLTTATGGGRICIASDGAEVHVLHGASDLYLWSADGTLGSAVGPTAIDTGPTINLGLFVALHDTGEVLVGYSHNGDFADAPRLYTNIRETATHSAVTGSSRITFGVSSYSKPWRIDGRWYVGVVARPTNYDITSVEPIPNASVCVLEVETDETTLTSSSGGTLAHVATLEDQTGARFAASMEAKPFVVGTTVYVPAAYRNREPENAATPVAVGFNLHTITVDDVAWGQTAPLGRAVLGASAAPFWYDGSAAMPYGFVHAPIIVSVGIAAGGSQADGTYGYQAAYGWRDANGVLHRSSVSPALSGTTSGGNDTLEPKFSTTSISSKQRGVFDLEAPSPAFYLIWRTEKNLDRYYSLVLQPQYNVVLNDPRDNDVTHTDGRADGSIASAGPAVALASQAEVYTADGVVNDWPPPAAIAALGHLDRGWLLQGDGHTVWATKAISDDPTVAPGFHAALTYYFARPKTCLGALPGAVVVFGEDSIDLLTGSGPDLTGAGSWGSQSVQTDLGCTAPRSLASIPQGLVYRSRRGIEMLTTGLTIEWIGEPIQDQLAAYPNVTSAVVVSDKRQVRISCNNDAGTAGRVLVYDYGRAAWSVWNYGFPVVDAAMIGNVYTLLRGNGAVYRESSTSCRDGTSYVSSAVTVSVTASGPQAWHRLKHAQVLGTSVTDHTLTMSIRRDFAADYEYTKTFASGSDVTEPGPLEKARITPPVQKGQGFVVRIEDTVPDDNDTADTGEGPILEQLAVWVQRKAGAARISPTRRG